MRMKPYVKLLTAVWIVVLAEGTTLGQGELEALGRPLRGEQKAHFSFDSAVYGRQSVGGQQSDMSWSEYRLRGSVPITQNNDFEWLLGTNVAAKDIATSAILPDADAGFPECLWDVSLSSVTRTRLQEGHIVGTHVTVGSPSDRPFATGDEISVNATGSLRIPLSMMSTSPGDVYWLWTLNYSNDRDFLQHVPLPGFGVVSVQDTRDPHSDMLVLGVPFSMLSLGGDDNRDPVISISYLLFRDVHARLTLPVYDRVGIYVGFDWDSEAYFRHDREDSDDRLFYYEKRIAGGVKWRASDKLSLDISAGWAYDRFWFEGDNYSHRSQNQLRIDDGLFAKGTIALQF